MPLHPALAEVMLKFKNTIVQLSKFSWAVASCIL
jgi:hypothetical protein